jgi:hypothetical protein
MVKSFIVGYYDHKFTKIVAHSKGNGHRRKTKAQHFAGRYHEILDDIEVSSHHPPFIEVMAKGRDLSTPGLYYSKGNMFRRISGHNTFRFIPDVEKMPDV